MGTGRYEEQEEKEKRKKKEIKSTAGPAYQRSANQM
jgi:hypothetical protein